MKTPSFEVEEGGGGGGAWCKQRPLFFGLVGLVRVS